jgi:hypothetical protein
MVLRKAPGRARDDDLGMFATWTPQLNAEAFNPETQIYQISPAEFSHVHRASVTAGRILPSYIILRALNFVLLSFHRFPIYKTIFTMVSTRSQALTPSKASSSTSLPPTTKWTHTPSNLTLIWLLLSLPLVAWDAGYVMLRPHSMPGGSLHWPIWQPYDLYGRVDYIYGWKAYNENNGFTAAQTFLNIVESAMYVYYLYILYAFGRQSTAQGRGAPKPASVGWLGEQRYVDGEKGALAVLVAFSAAVMTVSKTVLYCRSYFIGVNINIDFIQG